MGSSPVTATYGKNVWIFTKQKKNKLSHDEVLLKIAFFVEFEPTPQGIDWGMFDELVPNLVEWKLPYVRLSDNLILLKIKGSQSRKTSILTVLII